MNSKKEMQHVYLVGAKSLGAYGGYETFVYKLTEYHQNKENIKYHVACKANGDGCMDESKFEGVTKINDHEFELHNAHCFKIDVFMHCPNGVFDLEDKLLKGNNAFRSDEALHAFYSCMKTLYTNKYYWVADYKDKVGSDFMSWCVEFISSLMDERTKDVYWYYQENPNVKIYIEKTLAKIIKLLSFGKVVPKPGLRYEEMWLSYTTPSEFYSRAKILLDKFFLQMGISNSNIILDQLVLPHNLYRIENYFEDNCKVIVVDRDPRDVFLLNKYYWRKANATVPYSFDVEKFCSNYSKMRQAEKQVENRNILRIHFEDLIYNYDSSVFQILSFLDIPKTLHKDKLTKFVPEKSKKNTQIFNRNMEYSDEAHYIESKLPQYLYNFPSVEREKFSVDNMIL